MRGGLIISFMHFRKAWLKKRRPSVGAADKEYFDHKEGIFTNYYPHESLPIPDHGRNRLHNEIDDCIVCDKCAKVCPVDCIEIEAIKEPAGEIRKTSDGSSVRLHPAKFDIDMAKCCFCGLCTTVCPTECLTMTKTFDYSELDIRDMVYEFSYMSDSDVVAKKEELEAFNDAKKAKQASPAATVESKASPGKPKEVIPGAKKATAKPVIPGAVAKPKVVIPKPVVKKTTKDTVSEEVKTKVLKPVIKKSGALQPKINVKKAEEKEDIESKPKALKPVIKKPSALKPKITVKKPESEKEASAKPKALKPVIKPKSPPKPDTES